MKQSFKLAAGLAAALGLGIAAAAAHAHPGQMGDGAGSHGMGGMQHGMMGGMGQSPMGGAGAGQQLMTPEERTALIEKMRSAKTPEERQQIAAANRAEMQKRAQEKGITQDEHRGPHGGRHPEPAAREDAK